MTEQMPYLTSNRRTILKGAAALAGVAGLSPFGLPRALAGDQPDWVWQPMRWVQINFTDDDPGRYDPQFWLDFMRRTQTHGVCLSAGGISAFYPTEVPFHRRSPFLGASDPFGDLAKACKAMGLRVLARVDPSVVHADALAAHPEWVARSGDGKPRKHPDDPALYLSCPNGPFSFGWVPEVIREIMSRYPVDGIFGNRWSGGHVGICYCNVCKTEFRAATGLDLPPNLLNRRDPALIAYNRWSDAKRFDQIQAYNAAARAINPQALFAPGSSWQRLDPKRLRTSFRAIYADQQQRAAGNPVWSAGRGAKEAACIMQGAGPISGSVNVAQMEFKDSVQSIDETLTFLHDGMAQGFRPWLIKFKAEVFDKRWVAPIEQAFAWHARNERYFRNTDNLADVAVLQSLQTNSTYRSGGSVNLQPVSAMTAGGNEAALNGAYQALLEARVPFSLVDDRDLDPAILDRYRVILLPNVACLSDAQCDSIRQYVRCGGSIVASGETSLYTEDGTERTNFGLADLFGCDYAGQVDRKVENSYIGIHGPHPLTAGLDDTPRIVGGTRIVRVKSANVPPQNPLRLIRSYPDQPAEEAYPREPASDDPMAFVRTFGQGRVVYFPFNLEQLFWEQGPRDHLILLRNAVTWASGRPQPMTVSGAGLIDVSYFRQERSLAAHLVNLNNPSAVRGYMHETVPAGPFVVNLELPNNTRPSRIRLLEADRNATFRQSGSRLTVTVPHVALHEVIAVDIIPAQVKKTRREPKPTTLLGLSWRHRDEDLPVTPGQCDLSKGHHLPSA
ncbi:alpha-amylase family protein [Novosphingobium sp.]|uniref:alpha-amylase family protein n=1 Tax=Novosphingobium sp. TaxID=1874826 RepID=UPI002617F92E|nr:alpha-amylase family protein [Novosphingobium sp.]